MNAEPGRIRTEAEASLVNQFEDVKAGLPGAAVAQARSNAIAQIAEFGLPHRRVETWKYTDLRNMMRNVAPIAKPANDDVSIQDYLKETPTYRLVILNGDYRSDLSASDFPKGVSVVSFAQYLEQGGSIPGAESLNADDTIRVLTRGYARDGIVIVIEDNVHVETPFEIIHLATQGEASSYTQAVITAGKHAKATIIERFSPQNVSNYQRFTSTWIDAPEKSEIHYVRSQQEAYDATHLGTVSVELGADTQFNLFSTQLGSQTSRVELKLAFNGEHSEANLHGISMLKDKQHADTTLVVSHAVPHCNSTEQFKSVIDDEATSVFQGKIIVAKDAQKTDGKMSANALLLSDQATANVKPELEIFADDVVCGHGATCGQLDEDLLFYLLARGIPRSEAETLLIQAFLGDAVEGLENEAIRDAVMTSVTDWLSDR
jgi:Fe-S cluster assembly protein SufD